MVRNQAGQSLIQVLVSIALISILILAFASMMTNEQRALEQVNQKLASLDLERLLTSAFADGSLCATLFSKSALTAFDPMTVSSVTGAVETFVQIPPGTPSPLVAKGKPASVMSGNLVVQSISLTDVVCQSPCTASSNLFNGNLTVAFDPKKLVIPLRTITIPIIFSTTGGAGAQIPDSCVGNTQAMATCLATGGTWNAAANTCAGGKTKTPPFCLGKPAPGAACGTLCTIYKGGGISAPGWIPAAMVCSTSGWVCAITGPCS